MGIDFQYIFHGFQIALMPINIWYVFVGAVVGTIIGVLPGIGPAATIALLIPTSYGMNPTSALIMMAGVYYGAMYGGSTTSILVNMPGEASSVMTCIDGYQMAKNGRAGAALAVSAIGSFMAGTLAVLLLTVLAFPIVNMALKFGPPEYFTLMVFAMTAVTALSGKSFAKGMISTVLGLMITTIGIDMQSGLSRYTLGILDLQTGINFIIIAVGLFGISEVLGSLKEIHEQKLEAFRIKGRLWLTWEEFRLSIRPIFRGGATGFFLGCLPGCGPVMSSMIAYAFEKKMSKNPEKFGKGAIEGVASPESANNAGSCGAMVPLLTLGVPGSGVTAVMLGAFIMYGIQPGPLLFEKHPDLVWGLIDSMYVGNAMLLLLNLPLVGLFTRLLYVPIGMLMTLILGIATVAVYAVNSSMVDLYMMWGFGVLGYLFRKIDIPVAPMVLGAVLGDMMEQSFRQAMTISGGYPGIFVRSVISVTFLSLAVIVLTGSFLLPRVKKLRMFLKEDVNA